MMTALRENDSHPRVAIVGIGHELRGDDAAGGVIARRLKDLVADQPHILVIEGGSAPENHTGSLRRFAPNLVLLVDAADMSEPPGSVRWLSWQATTGFSASTHTLPVYVLSQYLSSEFGCDIALIGIQPAQMTIGKPLSFAVKTAVDEVIQILAAALRVSESLTNSL